MPRVFCRSYLLSGVVTASERGTVRLVRTMIVCLTLGAVLQVGVAWLCAFVPSVALMTSKAGSGQRWLADVPASWSGTPASTSIVRDDLGGRVVVQETGATVFGAMCVQSFPVFRMLTLTESGLPFRSMRFEDRLEVTFDVGLIDPWHESVRSGAPDLRLWRVPFPLTPIARGFVCNTIVYGMVIWLVVGVGTDRRPMRRRRGVCQGCAYDLQGIDGPCPECGVSS